MARRGADKEAVLAAARRVLEAHPTVVSQKRMGAFLDEELGRDDPRVAVTPDRARQLLVHAPFCRVEYKTREERRPKALYACPICKAGLRRLKNQTLFGGEVTLTLRCPACKYWTGRLKRVPILYTFHLRRARDASAAANP